MANVLLNGIVWLLRPVGMHVVNCIDFTGSDRLVEGGDAVIVGLGIVGRGVFLDEAAQVRVRLVAGIVALRHHRRGAERFEGTLARVGLLFCHEGTRIKESKREMMDLMLAV